MDRYVVSDKVGKGTYGVVYKAKDKKTGDCVALKFIDLNSEEGIPSTAVREIALLKFLRHANIIVLLDVIHMSDRLVMVFEFLDMDLKAYIDICPQGLEIQTAKSLLYQLLMGLAECHRMKVMHRDLKPANLLLTRSGILKLADFGLARTFAMPMSPLKHEIITVWYRGPELLLGETNYLTEVDLWSVGCIFGEMINGTPLFPGSDDEKQLRLIMDAMGTPDQIGWTDAETLPLYKRHEVASMPSIAPRPLEQLCPRLAQDHAGLHLLGAMLCMDPTKRITAEEATQHPFFNELKRRRRQTAPRSPQSVNPAQAPAQGGSQGSSSRQQQPPQQQQQPSQQPPQQQQQQGAPGQAPNGAKYGGQYDNSGYRNYRPQGQAQPQQQQQQQQVPPQQYQQGQAPQVPPQQQGQYYPPQQQQYQQPDAHHQQHHQQQQYRAVPEQSGAARMYAPGPGGVAVQRPQQQPMQQQQQPAQQPAAPSRQAPSAPIAQQQPAQHGAPAYEPQEDVYSYVV